MAAQELIAASAAAVVNASPSADGTHPNLGPLTLLRAGIPLIDAEPELLHWIGDGDFVEIDAGPIRVAGAPVGEGRSRPTRSGSASTRGASVPAALSASSPRTPSIGAMAGICLVIALGGTAAYVALAALVAISLYGEFRSLGALVEGVPLLGRLDSLGRVR